MTVHSSKQEPPVPNASDRQWNRLWRVTLATLVAMVACWSAFPWILDRAPPGDNLEQLEWSETPDWGFHKHPPFPTWILIAFAQVFPKSVPLTYGLAGLQAAILLLGAFLATRLSLGTRAAWISTLLITCLMYHNVRLRYYNHNSALMVACAFSVVAVWNAARMDRTIWWAALGCCWGLGALSKYQMAVPFGCNLLFLATASPLSRMRRLRGIAIAGAVCVTLIAPHVVWLCQHDFQPFSYASGSLLARQPLVDRVKDVAYFVGYQLGRSAHLIALVAILSWIARTRTPVSPSPSSDAASWAAGRLWAIHAWGPFLFMGSLSLVFGVDLMVHWGQPFLWAMVPWFMTTGAGRRISGLSPRTILSGVAATHLVLIAGWLASP